jgi:hypothetical protein
MLYHPIIQEVARYQQAERLATAERRHRLFRTPVTGATRGTAGGTVIVLPTGSADRRGAAAHVA